MSNPDELRQAMDQFIATADECARAEEEAEEAIDRREELRAKRDTARDRLKELIRWHGMLGDVEPVEPPPLRDGFLCCSICASWADVKRRDNGTYLCPDCWRGVLSNTP